MERTRGRSAITKSKLDRSLSLSQGPICRILRQQWVVVQETQVRPASLIKRPSLSVSEQLGLVSATLTTLNFLCFCDQAIRCPGPGSLPSGRQVMALCECRLLPVLSGVFGTETCTRNKKTNRNCIASRSERRNQAETYLIKVIEKCKQSGVAKADLIFTAKSRASYFPSIIIKF